MIFGSRPVLGGDRKTGQIGIGARSSRRPGRIIAAGRKQDGDKQNQKQCD